MVCAYLGFTARGIIFGIWVIIVYEFLKEGALSII